MNCQRLQKPIAVMNIVCSFGMAQQGECNFRHCGRKLFQNPYKVLSVLKTLSNGLVRAFKGWSKAFKG